MKKLLLVIALLAAYAAPAAADDSPEALQAIFMAALRANDAQGLANCYTSDAVNFPVDALIGEGPESVAAAWTRFFAAFTVIEATLSEQHLETHGDTAIAWGIFTIRAEPAEGGEIVEMQGRYMDVSRNIGGRWLYVADHASMPIPPPPEE